MVRALLVSSLLCISIQAQYRFGCSGPFAPNASHASLVKYFGAENVTVGDVYIGEGESETGTIVFPDDPEKRIEILWKTKNRRMPDSIRVGDAGDWNQTEWRTQKGITLGTTLRDVERINGRSFRLYGFSWDYAGTVTDWLGGALENAGPCTFLARLQPDPERPSEYEDRVAGDSEFSSGDPAMRAVNPIVYQMILMYPD